MRPSPRRIIQRRPLNAFRVARSRPEAASEFVRLEHERERLSQSLAALDDRRSLIQEQMARLEGQISTLHGMLDVKKLEAARESQRLAAEKEANMLRRLRGGRP